jgi:predicted nucleic acid-binding protein
VIAAFDIHAASAAADLAHTMRAKGQTLHHIEVMIAGIAIARGATLVTRDKDFAKTADAKFETWT